MVLAKAGAMGGAGLGTQLYDVVVIGGYSYSVPGVDEGYGAGVETVNGYFGEENHVLSSGLAREQIESRSWTWGRGSTHTRFAIAVIRHGAPRDWAETFAPVWWNCLIPQDELYARSLGGDVPWNVVTDCPITLRLQFGRFDT